MAIPVGTNKLKIFRRHSRLCTRYPEIKGEKIERPWTYPPVTKADEKADTCLCAIYATGYLKHETTLTKNGPKPTRVFVMLPTNNWQKANDEVTRMYKRGKIDAAQSPTPDDDKEETTVVDACKLFLESKTGASTTKVKDPTYDKYKGHIDRRLLPWCLEHNVVFIKAFEDKTLCRKYTQSW